MNTSFRWLYFFPLSLFFLCLGPLPLLYFLLTFDRPDTRRFDAVAWAEGHTRTRAAMARDAIRHLPPGTPEEKLLSLLGDMASVDRHDPPRSVSAFASPAVRTYAYHLGRVQRSEFGNAFLLVHIDADGKVILAEISED